MKLVIDTNRIIAALLKNSSCRLIIMNPEFEFISPDYTLTEIDKYKEMILEKSKLSKDKLNVVMSIIFEKIEIIPENYYAKYLVKASKLISDKKDVAFLALAMAKNTQGIWTEDKAFKEQQIVKIYSTSDLMRL